jgi:hypothetical protein
LIKNSTKAKVCIVLTAEEINDKIIDKDIYPKINALFVLKLASEEQSASLLGNEKAFKLHGNGDGYYYDGTSNEKSRFQTCYTNHKYLDSIIKIINTFYANKNI